RTNAGRADAGLRVNLGRDQNERPAEKNLPLPGPVVGKPERIGNRLHNEAPGVAQSYQPVCGIHCISLGWLRNDTSYLMSSPLSTGAPFVQLRPIPADRAQKVVREFPISGARPACCPQLN